MRNRSQPMIIASVAALLLGGCAAVAYEAPRADATPVQTQLKKLPGKPGERVAVTIYEFRSSLPALNSTTAVDMFKTALVHSGQFRVVERTRLAEGVGRERDLQASGQAKGRAAQQQLRGAQYVFEGVVSEANSAETQRSGGVSVGGMQIGGGSSRDAIAVDIRMVEAASGDIVDAVSVRKTIATDEANVSGVGSLLDTLRLRRGKASSAYAPEIQAQQRRAEGVDSAVRAAIDEAVLQIARRFQP